MSLLLNPRLLIALALAGILAFSHFAAFRKGKNDVKLEWQASVAAANEEARRLERARQSAVDSAVRLAATRADSLRVDSAGSAGELDRLRNAIRSAEQRGEQSAAAANQRASALGELLQDCGRAYQELARAADGHVNDIRLLLDAWPR